MLAHVVTRDAGPFGAALLTIRLILRGTPDPGPFGALASLIPVRFLFASVGVTDQCHLRKPVKNHSTQ